MPTDIPEILPNIDDEYYDSDEFPQLELDLHALSRQVQTHTGKVVTSCQKGRRGTYHEIYFITIDDGSKLVARVCRFIRDPASLKSEVATMNYVRSRTSIPVPTVHICMESASNDVGAQFVVMDYVEGVHLYELWDHLSLQHKKEVLTQVANVLSQLAGLHFGMIGSIVGKGGSVGPLLHRVEEEIDGKSLIMHRSNGPFSSTRDYLFSFVDNFADYPGMPDFALPSLQNVRSILARYLDSHAEKPYIKPPFRLIHPDFDGQNLLFADPKLLNHTDDSPRLMGVIDWDYAHTGPLYFLYEYPIFIQDVHWSNKQYEENAILRRHFVHALREKHPLDSLEHEEVRACVPSGKCSTLNGFAQLFMQGQHWLQNFMLKSIDDYVQEEEAGTGKAYNGRIDWVPDPDD